MGEEKYAKIVDKANSPICFDKRKCFARNGKRCTILRAAYDDRPCPFCKPSRD